MTIWLVSMHPPDEWPKDWLAVGAILLLTLAVFGVVAWKLQGRDEQ